MAKFPRSEELTDLYIKRKFSLSEISTITGFKIHKIIYWMDKYNIARRGRSEANYIKANPKGDPFNVKHKLTRNEVKLKYLALGIYWGEGSKTSNYRVQVTNSDPGVIRQFLRYLIEICKAKSSKIHFYLQTFKDNDILLAKQYWSGQLLIDPTRINTGKPLPSMGTGTYKKISANGVMSVAFFNTHLKSYILKQIKKLGLR